MKIHVLEVRKIIKLKAFLHLTITVWCGLHGVVFRVSVRHVRHTFSKLKVNPKVLSFVLYTSESIV